jgi:hypothetical protein
MENGRKKIHVLEGVNGWPKLNKNGERINQMNVYELCVDIFDSELECI